MILKPALRLLGLAVSLFMLFMFAYPVSRNILNIGNIFGMLFSGALSLILLFWSRFSALVSRLSETRGGKAAICFIGCLTVCAAVYFAVLSVLMVRTEHDEPRSDKTTLIVLGCKVKNGAPSLMLKRRLDTAYGYLSAHDDILVVVSGGRGSDESVSEAQCMKDYLAARGISSDRIIIENRSASTDENLGFSLELMRQNGLSGDITIVTDGFHQFRAECIAKRKGFKNISNIASPTTWWLVPTYWVREWFGITYLMISGG